jgi:hypothetical protein
VSADEETTDTTISPGKPLSERHLIILAPQGGEAEVESRVQPFAERVGLTLYDARLLLATKRPRLMRRVETARKARELSELLDELEIVHFDIAESEMESMPVKGIRRMHFEDGSLELVLAGEVLESWDYVRLVLLVRGEITRERFRESRMVRRTGASRLLTPTERLHLYMDDRSAAYELDPEQFDWDVLGSKQSTSTPFNLKRLTEEILRRAGHCELDRGFDWEPAVLSRSEAGTQTDLLLGSRETREGVIYDNQAQFRYYSRWRYCVARAERVRPRVDP